MFWKKEGILFEWVASKAVAIQAARSFNKYGLTAFPRIVAIITVLLAILYFVFDYLFPADPSFNLLNMFLKEWLFGIGLMFFCYFIFPWICIFDRTRYRITAKFVSTGGGQLKWHDLKGYVLSESQTIPGQKDLTFLTDGRPRTIHLPNDDLANQIIQYVAGRLPVFQSIPASNCPVTLTFLQRCCFIFCTVLYSGGIAFYSAFGRWHPFLRDESYFGLVLFLALILLLGPGTICSIGMFGWSFFKNKQSIGRALFLNVLGFFLSMWFGIILLLWQLKKAGGW